MKKKYILYISVLLLSTLLLTGCTKEDPEYDTSKVKVVGSDEGEEEIENPVEESNEESESTTDLGYLSDPSQFTKTKQTVGEVTDGGIEIQSIEESSNSGYHQISFTVNSAGDVKSLPLVTAEPVLDRGVIRVTFTGVEKDSSGIAYQQSRAIDLGAIGGIYHAVTSKEKSAIYEIGVAGNNPFKLEYQELDEGSWSVILKVAYDLKYAAPDIDYGSTQFSSEEQSIKGMTSSDGAKISSYSYSVTGGVLKFIYSVASGTSNPIPSVTASYDDQNILIVTFESLSSDKVSTWGKSITLPGGIVVEVSRSGEQSIYRFGGIGGKKDFKLSAGKSPNQVVVEIKM